MVDIYTNEAGDFKRTGRTMIAITNIGRRASTIRSFGYLWNEDWYAWIRRVVCRQAADEFMNRKTKSYHIRHEYLPKKLDAEEIWKFDITWRSFYHVPYGKHLRFFVRDSVGRYYFHKPIYSNVFRDHENESHEEVGLTLEEWKELLSRTSAPADNDNSLTWMVPRRHQSSILKHVSKKLP